LFRQVVVLPRRRRLRQSRPQRRKPRLLLKKRRRSMLRKETASLTKTLNARTVVMLLSSPVVSRSFTSRRASTTSLSVARSARMPRKPVWRVVVVAAEEAVVEVSVVAVETEMVVVAAEEEAHVMHSRRVTAPEAVPADSVTRVEEVAAEAVVEVSVVVADAVVTVVVVEEVAVSAMHSRRVTAPEAVPADSVTIKLVAIILLLYIIVKTWQLSCWRWSGMYTSEIRVPCHC
jgi:hypothetical protein